MAKILYVTYLWTALADMLYEGRPSLGMPGFIKPLEALLARGHEVELLIGVPDSRRAIAPGETLLRQVPIHLVSWHEEGLPATVVSCRRLWQAIDALAAHTHYDFLYAQGGTMAGVANFWARRHPIPLGVRLYGVISLLEHFQALERPGIGNHLYQWLALWYRHHLQIAAFRLPKAFLLVTNDGSHGDMIQQWIGTDRYRFFCWRNGFDPLPPVAPEDAGDNPLHPGRPFLIYPARVTNGKCQHRGIELLARLRAEQGIEVDLLFAGQIAPQDQAYHQALLRTAHEQQLDARISYLGALPLAELRALYASPQCIAVLSFADVSNLGNVAIETLAGGNVLISLCDGSLDDIVTSEESGFLVADMSAAAAVVQRLLSTPGLAAHIRWGALATIREHFVTWDARVAREVALIEEICGAPVDTAE